MKRSSFVWRLYAGFVLVIVVTAGIAGALLVPQLRATQQAATEEFLTTQAGLMSELLRARALPLEPGQPDLQTLISKQGNQLQTRLTVVRGDGVVLADSMRDPLAMDNHLDRLELRLALEHGTGSSVRLSSTTEMRMVYHARAVTDESRVLYFVRTSLPLAEVAARDANTRLLLLTTMVLAAIPALLAAYFIARRYTGPLREITQATEEIAGGAYERRVRARGSDELGQLARSFNSMADELRERIEIAQRDSGKLAAVLGGMSEGLIAIGEDEAILHVNNAARSILGLADQDFIGRAVWEAVRVGGVAEILRSVLWSGNSRQDEIRLVAGTRDRTILSTASPLPGDEGVPGGAVMVLQEVTELRHLEAVRRDFVANVSHELKTPVTAIQGFAETLVDDPRMPEETRQRFVGKILTQSLRLHHIVMDLLTLSRLESGREVSAVPVVLNALLESVVTALLPADENPDLAVSLELPADRVEVCGDQEGLRMLFGNLIDNARKYTPAGRITVHMTCDNGNAVVKVSDTGIGIEPAHLDRVFERFYRVDKARSRDVGGTGLGLSIVRHLSRVHGGEVAVESAPGKGTTFTVVLPRVTGEPGSEAL